MVRRIYDDFLTGATYDEIAEALAKESVPTKRPGSVWKSKTVANIIGNEKYCGDCLFQKSYIEDPLTHKHRINQGQLPQFFVEDCLPVIIEKEKWRAVQEMRKRHNAHTRYAVERAPFRNMIFCGVCGKPVVPHYTHTLNRQMLLRYRCSSYKGMNGMAIEGTMYTPPPKANYVLDVSPEMQAYREKYGRPFPPRQMLCTDIRLPEDKPRKAFVQVWNILVSRLQRLTTTLSHTAETDENALTRFKAREMIGLLDSVGKIEAFNFFLMRRTVDRFVTTMDGRLTVVFLCGIKMTI